MTYIDTGIEWSPCFFVNFIALLFYFNCAISAFPTMTSQDVSCEQSWNLEMCSVFALTGTILDQDSCRVFICLISLIKHLIYTMENILLQYWSQYTTSPPFLSLCLSVKEKC